MGTIKWLDPSKGYGFILRPGLKDIFFHTAAWEGEGKLLAGDSVTFEACVSAADGRPKARRIRRVSGESSGESAAGATASSSG